MWDCCWGRLGLRTIHVEQEKQAVNGGTACVKRCQLCSSMETLFKRLCLISPARFTRVDYRLDAIQTCCSVKLHWPLKQLEASFYEQNRFKQANALWWSFINGRKKICWNQNEAFEIATERDFWNNETWHLKRGVRTKKESSTPFLVGEQMHE